MNNHTIEQFREVKTKLNRIWLGKKLIKGNTIGCMKKNSYHVDNELNTLNKVNLFMKGVVRIPTLS